MSSEYVATHNKFSLVIALMSFSVALSMLYNSSKSVKSFSSLLLLTLLAIPRKIETNDVEDSSEELRLFNLLEDTSRKLN